jgi:hypothetical protein
LASIVMCGGLSELLFRTVIRPVLPSKSAAVSPP